MSAPPPPTATILDGKALAARVRAGLATEAVRLAGRGVTPGLARAVLEELGRSSDDS